MGSSLFSAGILQFEHMSLEEEREEEEDRVKYVSCLKHVASGVVVVMYTDSLLFREYTEKVTY